MNVNWLGWLEGEFTKVEAVTESWHSNTLITVPPPFLGHTQECLGITPDSALRNYSLWVWGHEMS